MQGKQPICLYGKVSGGSGAQIHSTIYKDQKCVIKSVAIDGKETNPRYKSIKKDLYFESSLLKDIYHPNIVKLYQPCIKGMLLDAQGIPFIAHYSVFEMLEGRDLLFYAERRTLSEDELRYYFAQIVDAVCYLHSKEIAHQDLKSDNIVLDGSLGVAKLVDFGYSIRADQAHIGSIRGTLEYIAPEVHNMIPHSPKKADVFSLGVMLHTLATGKFPCVARCIPSDSMYRLLCEKKYEDFWARVTKGGPELTDELKELIQTMIHPSLYYRPSIEQVKTHRWFDKRCLPKEIILKTMRERQTLGQQFQ